MMTLVVLLELERHFCATPQVWKRESFEQNWNGFRATGQLHRWHLRHRPDGFLLAEAGGDVCADGDADVWMWTKRRRDDEN